MPEGTLHFAAPWWLLGLLLIAPVAWWLRHSLAREAQGPIHRYADAHLLPHLTGVRQRGARERWTGFALWSLLWTLALLAMAGPRWDAREVRLFHPGNNLLILLDISRSMQATDLPPSRLARARHEIQDLLHRNRELRVGLIAFASLPYVIAPVTEDRATLLRALPELGSDLTPLQGSRLGPALARAGELLAGLPADSARSILLLSDGDFDEPDLDAQVRALAEQGIRLFVLGIGTPEGDRVPGPRGAPLTGPDGQPVHSALDESQLEALARAGEGFYLRADYRAADTDAVIAAASRLRLPPEAGTERTQIWNERYWIPLLLLLALLAPRLRQLNWRG